MQTVLDLRWQGKEVFLVADAVGSRKPADRRRRWRMQARVEIVTREMVAFEWLQAQRGPLFRDVNRDFIRDNYVWYRRSRPPRKPWTGSGCLEGLRSR
jgi:hypothetical protein